MWFTDLSQVLNASTRDQDIHDKIYDKSEFYDLHKLKVNKDKRIRRCRNDVVCTLAIGGGSKGFCKNCCYCSKRLTDQYHKYGGEIENRLDNQQPEKFKDMTMSDLARSEITYRLKYEFVFGLIKEREMATWMAPSLRDWGHTLRMKKLRWIVSKAY